MSKQLSNKSILTCSFFLAFISSTIMLFFVQNTENGEDPSALSLIILMTRCGINLAFCFVFVIHTEIFPTVFLGTSYGICNFICRTVTLLAPLMAESKDKAIPLTTLMVACLVGTICCLSLKKIDVNKDNGKCGALLEKCESSVSQKMLAG